MNLEEKWRCLGLQKGPPSWRSERDTHFLMKTQTSGRQTHRKQTHIHKVVRSHAHKLWLVHTYAGSSDNHEKWEVVKFHSVVYSFGTSFAQGDTYLDARPATRFGGDKVWGRRQRNEYTLREISSVCTVYASDWFSPVDQAGWPIVRWTYEYATTSSD